MNTNESAADYPGSVLYASLGPNIFCTPTGRIAIAARGACADWHSVSLDPLEIPIIIERLQAGAKLSAKIIASNLENGSDCEREDSLQDESADFPGSMLYASIGPNIFCTDEGRIAVAVRDFGGTWQIVSFDPLEIPIIIEGLQAMVKLSAKIIASNFENGSDCEREDSLRDEPADFPGAVLYASTGQNIFCTDGGRIAIAVRGIGGTWQTVSFDPLEIPIIVERLQAGVKLSTGIIASNLEDGNDCERE